MIDIQRIDNIIKLALLEACRADDPWDRELGQIHLIKHVYLADLAYAEHHEGKTYTGTPWRFYNFGPWAEAVIERIEPAVKSIGAKTKKVSYPQYDKDSFRYSCSDDYPYEEVYNNLPLEISGIIKKAIHQYGKDTAELLHYVYRTRPMICAAPGEELCFDYEDEKQEWAEEEIKEAEKLSVKRKRAKKEAVEKLKNEMASRLEKTLREKQVKVQYTPPRYDEVYYEGLECTESLSGEFIKEEKRIIKVSPDFWKSKFRTDAELC